MDAVVALVQAHLHVSGHFTVAEHPVPMARGGEVRTVPDLGILAYRLPSAGDDLVHPNDRPDEPYRGAPAAYPHDPWHLLRPTQFHDEGLGTLALMEKWGLRRLDPDRLSSS